MWRLGHRLATTARRVPVAAPGIRAAAAAVVLPVRSAVTVSAGLVRHVDDLLRRHDAITAELTNTVRALSSALVMSANTLATAGATRPPARLTPAS